MATSTAAKPKAPTTELGAEQWNSTFQPPVLDDHEINADTAWPMSVTTTYPAMLNDAHVEGMYRGVTLPIRAYDWHLLPNGARPEVVDRVSASYNLPIGPDGQIDQARSKHRFIFDDHLEDALRGPAYGHYFFEQVYDVRQDGDPRFNDGWVAHLRKLAPRPARSIIEIRPASDNGLLYIKVPAAGASNASGTGIDGFVDIPIDRLVAYDWDREGGNWAGRSMLRSCYQPWKLKGRVLRVGAINIERAGGVPYIEAPAGAGPDMMRELFDVARLFRVGEGSGAALPFGAQLKFAAAGGGDQAIAYVRLQNEEMARAWVQMLMMLGQTETGSRSLGETFADSAHLVEMAIAGWFAKRFTRHVIEDDVEINEGPAERYAPMLGFKPKGDPVDALAGAIDNAQVAGALPSDSQAAATVRAAAGEKQRDRRPARPRLAATATTGAAADSKTDFADLQARYEQALADATATWSDVQADQIDDLHGQIARAKTLSDLTAIVPAVAGAAALATVLHGVLKHGAESAAAEAKAQGVTLPTADIAPATATLDDATAAKADILARSLGQSAASRAVSLAAGGNADMATVADQTREYLQGLTGATPSYELGGLISQAQNQGRFAQMTEAPDGTRYYASAVNDTNECDACADEDETEFDSLDDAMSDFPSGGYVGCEGGERCRCTVVGVYGEAAPSA